MKLEDYFKYYIQDSDHYLIPQNEFIELFNEMNNWKEENQELKKQNKKYKEVIDKAIEYINKYAWQEEIISDIYTTNGKPAINRYMQLDWDNCNELLDILKEVE